MSDEPFKGIGEWRAQARKVEEPDAGWDVLKEAPQAPAGGFQTVDDLARGLRRGELSVDDVIEAMQGSAVVVYPGPTVTDDKAKTWQSVEEDSTGSTLMADLRNAGADEDDLFEVGAHIERARQEGRTFDKVYNRTVGEGTAPSPGTTTSPAP